ncbi:hypothetical protein AAT19DRAFT_12801 [Rhodotorula toruloides]|uniref:Uncharacterized protein n=1 Tax=Rhodotorula toruloides TaxID=5286 RepID=A0A2T0ACP8_RHOTO|nr:hypothetical protein AAT19DRAFT_12801 [Rhodotorula toruloides]
MKPHPDDDELRAKGGRSAAQAKTDAPACESCGRGEGAQTPSSSARVRSLRLPDC